MTANAEFKKNPGKLIETGIVLYSDNTPLAGRRVCCFAHYDPQSTLDPTVFHYLQAITEQGFYIIFISTSPTLPSNLVASLARICSRILIRPNEGLDFASWKCGFITVPEILQAKELLLANDSVWLVRDLAPVMGKMEQTSCDFWGMTASRKLLPHLQSYFLLFRKTALQSKAFGSFWDSVRVHSEKQSIIGQYEVTLTLRLALAKLTPAAWIPTLEICNPSLRHGLELTRNYGMPLLKRELLRSNPCEVDLHTLPLLPDGSACSLEEIKAHLFRLGTSGCFAPKTATALPTPPLHVQVPPPEIDVLLPLTKNAAAPGSLPYSLDSPEGPRIRILVDGHRDDESACIAPGEQTRHDTNVRGSDTNALETSESLNYLLHCSTAPYFLIADQGCTHQQDRAARMLAKMRELESIYGTGYPLLVFSDVILTDEHGTAKWSLQKEAGLPPLWGNSLHQTLICASVPGFAMVGNAALRKAILPLPERYVSPAYAWWILLTAKTLGIVDHVAYAPVFYKKAALQPDHGGRREFSLKYFSRGIGRLKRDLQASSRLVAALLLRHGSHMAPKTRTLCEVMAGMLCLSKREQIWQHLRFGFLRHELPLLCTMYGNILCQTGVLTKQRIIEKSSDSMKYCTFYLGKKILSIFYTAKTYVTPSKKIVYAQRCAAKIQRWRCRLFGPEPNDTTCESAQSFSGHMTDIRALAFYLPQFHTIPENDEWWGKEFTEWTNVRAGRPRFFGHDQPRVPHPDIGYYDLSNPETLRRQAALAKRHGIYGFCFYHYWFSGRRLLEKPLDLLLANPDIDLPFCLCWANESWGRNWDGEDHKILMEQPYNPGDPELFIDDNKKYLLDPRYITIDGRPLLLIYREPLIPNANDFFRRMKARAAEIHLPEPLIYVILSYDLQHPETITADGLVEFVPHRPVFAEKSFLSFSYKGGRIFNYADTMDTYLEAIPVEEAFPLPVHKSVCLAWDNSARRKDGWRLWTGFSQKKYYSWLEQIVAYTRRNFPDDRRFVFINAWNEWGEGTYLEPDARTGYASLNTTSKALYDMPFANADPDKTRTPPD